MSLLNLPPPPFQTSHLFKHLTKSQASTELPHKPSPFKVIPSSFKHSKTNSIIMVANVKQDLKDLEATKARSKRGKIREEQRANGACCS